jgi:hypothetical protein
MNTEHASSPAELAVLARLLVNLFEATRDSAAMQARVACALRPVLKYAINTRVNPARLLACVTAGIIGAIKLPWAGKGIAGKGDAETGRIRRRWGRVLCGRKLAKHPSGEGVSLVTIDWRSIYDSLLNTHFRGVPWETWVSEGGSAVLSSHLAKFHASSLLSLVCSMHRPPTWLARAPASARRM